MLCGNATYVLDMLTYNFIYDLLWFCCSLWPTDSFSGCWQWSNVVDISPQERVGGGLCSAIRAHKFADLQGGRQLHGWNCHLLRRLLNAASHVFCQQLHLPRGAHHWQRINNLRRCRGHINTSSRRGTCSAISCGMLSEQRVVSCDMNDWVCDSRC